MTNTRHSTRRALVGYFGTEHTGPVTELVRHLAPHVEMVGFHYEKASNQSMALRMLTPQIDGQERHDPYDIVLFMAQFAIPHVSDIEPLARAVGRPNLLEEVKLQAQKTKCEDLDNLSLGVYAAKSLLSPAHLFISVPAYLMTPEEIRKNPAADSLQKFPLLKYELMGATVLPLVREFHDQANLIAQRVKGIYSSSI